uniref:Collagen partial=5 n=1 Tax=Chionoecetes opilio bacilliform virus TaxID=1825681 RepID=A0A1Q3DLH8_9VIRU|nr:wsv001-like protein [Chionoecetes opilio bacilliform virus]GAV93183.1 collagen partial=5 [Chionoecetes opilio bacilliform virus]
MDEVGKLSGAFENPSLFFFFLLIITIIGVTLNRVAISQTQKDDPTGPKGDGGQQDQGADGTRGPRGVQGVLGKTGYDGARGPRGVQGALGKTGYDGTRGSQGIQGALGENGYDGTRGPRGIQGALGKTGYDGLRGPRGIQGTLGKNGYDGLRGPRGIQGTLGETGYDGLRGPRGVQGAAGGTGARGQRGNTGATRLVKLRAFLYRHIRAEITWPYGNEEKASLLSSYDSRSSNPYGAGGPASVVLDNNVDFLGYPESSRNYLQVGITATAIHITNLTDEVMLVTCLCPGSYMTDNVSMGLNSSTAEANENYRIIIPVSVYHGGVSSLARPQVACMLPGTVTVFNMEYVAESFTNFSLLVLADTLQFKRPYLTIDETDKLTMYDIADTPSIEDIGITSLVGYDDRILVDAGSVESFRGISLSRLVYTMSNPVVRLLPPTTSEINAMYGFINNSQLSAALIEHTTARGQKPTLEDFSRLILELLSKSVYAFLIHTGWDDFSMKHTLGISKFLIRAIIRMGYSYITLDSAVALQYSDSQGEHAWRYGNKDVSEVIVNFQADINPQITNIKQYPSDLLA